MVSTSEFMWGLYYKRDPRVRDRALTSSPTIILSAMIGYMLLVVYGPKLMRGRKTPPLKHVMMLYNACQVMLSAYMTWEFYVNRPSDINWLMCSAVDITYNPTAQRLLDVCMVFHVSKIIDFLDTLFLILKKDHKRMSYLHVYHHGTMVFGFWFATAFVPGGSTWFGGVVNSFVHCVMYSYYLLSSLGPRVRPFLWWKRYLTQLQLAQFALIVCLGLAAQIAPLRCGYPMWVLTMAIVYLIVLSVFFLNFYIKAYIDRAPASKSNQTTAVRNGDATGSGATSQSPEAMLKTIGRTLLSHGVGCYVKED